MTVFFFSIGNVKAQVSVLLNPTYGYTFLNTTSTYTSLGAGGTVFQSGTTINTDGVSASIALPFTFTFNGIKENNIFISNNGFITFATAPAATNYTPLSTITTSGYDGAIAGTGMNCVASTAAGASPEIRYGSNGGGDFVIQFQDIGQSLFAGIRMTYQIILKADGKTVQIVYGPNNVGVASSGQCQVGLRGTNDEDWNNRTLASGGNWNTAGGAAGTLNSSGMTLTAASTLPTSGRTFQWSPTSYTPTYLTNPGGVVQNFTTWVNGAGPVNIPSTNWATNGYGNASWQIDNTTASTTGSGWTGTSGAYTPADYVNAVGGRSARFHSQNSNSPQVGYLDYYVDMSTITGTPTLDFFHINTSGTDILRIFLSTDGGTTFTQLGANIGVSATWTAISRSLGATNSATTIIRFKATSDFGFTDIGLDRVVITPPPALPTISGFSPTPNLCANGGQTVTITGTNFTGTTAVTFNGVNAVSFSVVNSTTITAVTPSGLTVGTIDVTNPAGTASSSAYTVVSNPTVAVTPTSNSLCVPGATAVALSASGASTYSWGPAAGLSATTGTSVNALPTSSTTYTVTGTDGNGCTATSTSVFTITAGVSATASASPLNVCNGSNSQLNVTSTQISTNTIGAGGTNSSSTAASFLPGAWGGAKTQYIIRASELTAQGMVAGNLKSIAFEPTTAGQTYQGFFVNIGSTASTAMTTSFITTGLTEVYAGTLTDNGFLPVANTVNTLTFGTGGTASSFYWDGTSNIVVSISWSRVPGASTATASTMKVDAPGFTCSAYDQQDNVSPATMKASATADATGTNRPKFIFTEDILLSPTYAWTESPATTLSSTTIANPMSNGITATNNYTVTVTGSGGCTATSTLTVNVASSVVCSPITSSNGTSLCAGQNTTLTASATIGGTPYTYVWTLDPSLSATNIANPVATPSATTTYTCTVTDACGTTCSTTLTINVNSLPTVGVSPSSSNICNPGGTAVTLTASGTATGYTWLPAAGLNATTGANVDALPTSTTTYTVTGTDANGCSATSIASVAINLYPVLTALTATPTTVCSNGTSDLLVVPQTATTAASMVYNASTGASLETMTSSTVVTTPTSGTIDDGYITVSPGFTFPYLGTNITSFGVSTNGYVVLGGNSSSIPSSITTLTGINVIYAFGRDGNLNTTNAGNLTHGPAAGGKYVFEMNKYSGGSGGAESATIYATYQIVLWGASSADPGKIEVIYGANASTPATAGTIGIRDAANTFINGVNGSTSLTTTSVVWPSSGQKYTYSLPAAPSYSWSPATFLNSTTIANPQATLINATTTYTVTASSNGCSTISSVTVSLAGSIVCSPITSSNGSTLCAGQNTTLTASATVGGTPYTYVWDADPSLSATNIANPVATPTATTTYTCTVTDACGTTCSTTITINVNPTPTASASSNGPLCVGANLNLTGTTDIGTTFNWSGPNSYSSALQNTSISGVTALQAGIYTLTATENGCTSLPSTVTVVVNPIPSAITITPASATITCGTNQTLVAAGGEIVSSSILGTGTGSSAAASTSATLGPNPLQSYYGGTKQQMLILASELTSMGLVNGSSISSIAFNLSAVEARTLLDYQVKMKLVSQTSFASTTFVTGLTTVKTAASYTPVSGWNTIPLTSNFTWDGTNNLVIEVNFSNNDAGGTGTNTALLSTTGFASSLFYRGDNVTASAVDAQATASFAAYSSRNNITLSYSSPTSVAWTPSVSLNTAVGPNVTASPGATTTYTVTASANGCSSSNTVVVTVNPNPDIALSSAGNTASTVGTSSSTLSQADGTTEDYKNTTCNTILTIQDIAGGNVLGSTTATTTVSATLPTDNSLQQYIPRYYNITASSATCCATITLKLNQADFTTYNNLKGGFYLAAPTSGNNADANIANIFVAQLVGGINGTMTEITPTSLVWDGTNNNWNLTFNTAGSNFNGDYYIFTKTGCNLMVNYASMATSSITSTSAIVNWSSVPGVFANTYKIRIKPVSGSVWNGQTVTSNTYTFAGLLPNTLYEYQIRVACSGSSQGAYSASKTFTTAAPPCTQPVSLTANSITSSTALIGWSNTGATSYSVRVRVVGNAWAGNTIAATNSLTVTGLLPSTNYEYQVIGNCSGNFSPWSTTGTFLTIANPCTVPTSLTSTGATASSVLLSWSNTGATSYSYRFRVAGNPTWGSSSVTSTNSKTVTGLTPGTNYEFQVIGNCSGVFSAWSGIGTFSTIGTACIQPTGLSTSAISTTGATLNWTSTGAAGYSYRVRIAGNPWAGSNGVTTNTKVLTGLTANTTYEYQVISNCGGGIFSTWSNIASFVTGASLKAITGEILSDNNQVSVYPNPTKDKLNIEFIAAVSEDAMVKVMDMTGRVVKVIRASVEAGNNTIEVSLSEFSAGMYTIQLFENNSLTHVGKVQKQD